jgi:hypothetical protein
MPLTLKAVRTAATWEIVRLAMAGVCLVGLGAGLGSRPAVAEPLLVKQAKDAGFPAQNCRYCHTSALPKKEGFKPEELNDRGTWLIAEKKKRNAPKVDLSWLKEYPGGAEQK